jgi:hypothetical protein
MINILLESSPDEIREIFEAFRPYLPLVDETIDELAPILDKVFGRMLQYIREQTKNTFNYYLEQGFSRQEAMLLTLNASAALQKTLENIKTNKK